MEFSDLSVWKQIMAGSVMFALLVALPLWLFWLGRFPRIPAGRRYPCRTGRYKVDVVFTGTVLDGEQAIAKRCADAVWSIGTAWIRHHTSQDSSAIHHVVVQFLPDSAFSGAATKDIRNANAYLTVTGANIGPGVPMAVMRANSAVLDAIAVRGDPVIHECIHALLSDTTEHGVDMDHEEGWAWGGQNDWDGHEDMTAHAEKLLRAKS